MGSSDPTGRHSREANVLSGLLASKRSYINWKAVSGVSSGRRSALEGDPLVTWLGNFQREIFIEHSSRNGSFSRHIWFLKGTPLRKNALRITGLCLGLLRDGDIAIYIYIHQTMAILVVEIMINHVLLFLHFQTYHFMVYQPTLLSQGWTSIHDCG